MAEWLKALTALTETLSSLLSTQIWQFMIPAQIVKRYSMDILYFGTQRTYRAQYVWLGFGSPLAFLTPVLPMKRTPAMNSEDGFSVSVS